MTQTAPRSKFSLGQPVSIPQIGSGLIYAKAWMKSASPHWRYFILLPTGRKIEEVESVLDPLKFDNMVGRMRVV